MDYQSWLWGVSVFILASIQVKQAWNSCQGKGLSERSALWGIHVCVAMTRLWIQIISPKRWNILDWTGSDQRCKNIFTVNIEKLIIILIVVLQYVTSTFTQNASPWANYQPASNHQILTLSGSEYKPPLMIMWNTKYMWRHSPSGTKLSFVRVKKMLEIIWATTARPMLTACSTTWWAFCPGWGAIWNLAIVSDCSSEDWTKTVFVTTSSYFGLWMNVLETIFMVSLWLDL